MSGTPSLAIYKYGGVNLIHGLSDGVHSFNIVATHQVEAEAVDMIFVNPVFHRLYHEAAHHGLFGGRLVAAAGAVGVSPVGILAVIIVGIGLLEIGVIDVVGMVIHHVENHADACLVEGLHHLLELADAAERIVGVGAVAALGHVIVHGIVAPVVLVVLEPRLVDRTIVVAGQDMNGIHAQFFQVANSLRLGQRQELSLVDQSR